MFATLKRLWHRFCLWSVEDDISGYSYYLDVLERSPTLWNRFISALDLGVMSLDFDKLKSAYVSRLIALEVRRYELKKKLKTRAVL